MPYATPDQVRNAIAPDRERRAGTAASLTDDVLNEKITDAGYEVDAAASRAGYAVPFPDDRVPDLVRAVVVAIAAWAADLSFRKSAPHENRLSPVLQRYDWAQKWLDLWAKGERAIPGAETTPDVGGGDVVLGPAVNRYPGPLFTEAELDPFAGVPPVGDDRLYDPDWYRWGAERGWL